MMPELLFLLLPVAAFSGWWLGRPGKRASQDQQLACAQQPDYYKGINFLLNEQPDKAIDVFIQLLEVDSETVETHLALGSLFRKRGEVDRAIRIHQNLIARPSLDQEQRANALLELGQDYMTAGLFDRAENLFGELAESGKLQVKALHNLKDIYQREKVWDRCLQVVKQLENLTHQSFSVETAHYYCELAELAQRNNEPAQTAELVKKAKQANPTSVRALMMEASLEVAGENYRKALRLYEDIIRDEPGFVSEVLDDIITCYRHQAGQADLLAYLGNLFEQTRDSEVLRRLVEMINQSSGAVQAADYLLRQLQDSPSLPALQLLATLPEAGQDHGQGQGSESRLRVFAKTLESELEQRPSYSCKRCGFTAKTLHWQCPGCRSWGTIKPAHDHDPAQMSGVTV